MLSCGVSLFIRELLMSRLGEGMRLTEVEAVFGRFRALFLALGAFYAAPECTLVHGAHSYSCGIMETLKLGCRRSSNFRPNTLLLP